MKLKISFLLAFLFITCVQSQEISASVIINSDKIEQTNRQIFITLQNSLNEFINLTSWTNKPPLPEEERVKCNILITLDGFNNTVFTGSLQIQIQRPVYKSTYSTPIFFYKDDDIQFTYQEYQPLIFNSATFQSNLVSLISFYSFIALGIEADTFAPTGGTNYYIQAQKITNLAQQSGFRGWNQNEGRTNRYWLIDALLSNTHKDYRLGQYIYHRKGLDKLVTEPKQGKEGIILALYKLRDLYNIRPNSFLLNLFFDTKSDEIVDIYSGGPEVNLSETLNILNTISSYFNSKWKKLE